MPVIVTTIHDPSALAATCNRFGIADADEGIANIDGYERAGLLVDLGGLHGPLVFDTLSGLVWYVQRDNVHFRYARIMRFIHRYYDVRAAMRREQARPVRLPFHRRRRSQFVAGAVA